MSALKHCVAEWLALGRRVAVATVTHIEGSSPVPVGTAMAFTDVPEVYGSIGAGCIDGAIVQQGKAIFDGVQDVSLAFSADDDPLTAAALPCGSSIRVQIRRITAQDVEQLEAPPARLQLFAAGANAYSKALAELCAPLGYALTIFDPRPAFADERHYTGARMLCGWPPDLLRDAAIENGAVLQLAHDDRYDAAFLLYALRSGAFYVGALGSRRTQAARCERLIALGCTVEELRRLHAPAGLDLGGETPQEATLAILAEILATRTGAGASSLRARQGPIHRPHLETATLPPPVSSAATTADRRAAP